MHVLETPWLKLKSHSHLLAQFAKQDEGYTVRITDLQRVWGEDLDAQALIDRASELEAPFAEDDMDALLKHLESGITQPSDSVVFTVEHANSEFEIRMSSKLGTTDIDLQWCYNLQPLSATATALGLTLGFGAMLVQYQEQVASLLKTIKSKDGVIRSMTEFCTENKLEYRPHRRRPAYLPFEREGFADSSREAFAKQVKSVPEVLALIDQAGRIDSFRQDWQVCLSRVDQWEQGFQSTTSTTNKASRSDAEASPSEFVDPGVPKPDTRQEWDYGTEATTDGETQRSPSLQRVSQAADESSSGSPEVRAKSPTATPIKFKIGGKKQREASPAASPIQARISGKKERTSSPEPRLESPVVAVTPVKSRIGGKKAEPIAKSPSPTPTPSKSRVTTQTALSTVSPVEAQLPESQRTSVTATPVKSRIGGRKEQDSPVNSRIGGADLLPDVDEEPRQSGTISEASTEKAGEPETAEDVHERRRKRLEASIALASAKPAAKKRRQF